MEKIHSRLVVYCNSTPCTVFSKPALLFTEAHLALSAKLGLLFVERYPYQLILLP